MEQAIRFLLSNFTLTLFGVGLLASLVALLRRPRPWSRATIIEALLSWFLFFSLGVSFLYNFVMHVFFSEMAAAFIGWQTSPFQKEVGFASLGFSVVGFLAFKGSPGLRLAALVGPACFL
jgi:small-conductance mechanosensitive channel